jgi:hypothetical protein
MKFIKATEQLPTKEGWYFIKRNGQKYAAMFRDGELEVAWPNEEIEWLDDSQPQQSFSRKRWLTYAQNFTMYAWGSRSLR